MAPYKMDSAQYGQVLRPSRGSCGVCPLWRGHERAAGVTYPGVTRYEHTAVRAILHTSRSLAWRPHESRYFPFRQALSRTTMLYVFIPPKVMVAGEMYIFLKPLITHASNKIRPKTAQMIQKSTNNGNITKKHNAHNQCKEPHLLFEVESWLS